MHVRSYKCGAEAELIPSESEARVKRAYVGIGDLFSKSRVGVRCAVCALAWLLGYVCARVGEHCNCLN